jgi:hypothetical protein
MNSKAIQYRVNGTSRNKCVQGGNGEMIVKERKREKNNFLFD